MSLVGALAITVPPQVNGHVINDVQLLD